MVNNNNKIIQRQSGQVLLLLLVVICVASLIITPAVGLLTAVSRAGQSQENRNQQLYAADAGTKIAFWDLNKLILDPLVVPQTVGVSKKQGYGTFYPLGPVNGYDVAVTILYQSNVSNELYKTTSEVYSGGVLKNTVVSYMTRFAPIAAAFENAIAATDGDITLLNETVSSIPPPPPNIANLYANGDITLVSNNNTVYGNAYVTTGNTISGSGVSGTSFPPGPTKNFATIDITTYIAEASAASSGTLKAPATVGTTLTGPVRIAGNLTVSGDLTVNGDIYIDGSLTVLGGKLTVNANGGQKGALYVKTNCVASNNGNNTQKGVIQTAGTVYIGGDFTLDQGYVFDQKGVVAIQGNLDMEKWQMGSPTNMPVILVGGSTVDVHDVDLAEKTMIYAYIYAPYADFVQSPSAASSELYGALVCRSADLKNLKIFYIVPDTNNIPGGGSPQSVLINTWNIAN